MYQGKPADGFHIAFNPLAEQTGPKFAPSAVTDANGEFRLRSYEVDDGAAPGDYAVTITWPQTIADADPADAPRQVDRLRGRFSDPRRSAYKITVHEGENALQPFELK